MKLISLLSGIFISIALTVVADAADYGSINLTYSGNGKNNIGNIFTPEECQTSGQGYIACFSGNQNNKYPKYTLSILYDGVNITSMVFAIFAAPDNELRWNAGSMGYANENTITKPNRIKGGTISNNGEKININNITLKEEGGNNSSITLNGALNIK